MTAIESEPIASPRDTLGIVLRVAVVGLTLATAYIHYTLGGMMFMANALGYVLFAALMVVPIAFVSRYRWVIRAGLLGFTVVTILGWVVMGGRMPLAYMTKAIELGLVAALVIEMWRYDGGPINVLRRLIQLAVTIVRMPFGRSKA
ncbi:MAG: hypothetical protein ABI797_04360 [Chloroflexota bacterium]